MGQSEIEALVVDPTVGVLDAGAKGAVADAPDVGGEAAEAGLALRRRTGGLAVGLPKSRGIAAANTRLEGVRGRVRRVVRELLQQKAQMAPEGAALRDHAAGVAYCRHDGGAIRYNELGTA